MSLIRIFSLAAAVMALLCVSVLAQENPAREQPAVQNLRDLNSLILRHHEGVHQARPADRGAVRTRAAADILRREAALAALSQADPDSALKAAFSADLLEELRAAFPDSAEHLEKQGVWEGALEAVVEDHMGDGAARSIQLFRTGDTTFTLHSSDPASAGAPSRPVTVRGMAVAGHLAVSTIARAGAPAASVTATSNTLTGAGPIGPQNIVTILVNLPAYKLASSVTADFMKGVLYGNANTTATSTTDWNVSDYWQQASDGKTAAPFSQGKVVGPYLLASNYNVDLTGAAFCDYITMKQAVLNAVGPAVDFTQYNRVVIVMPNNGACTWSGVSSIGYWSSTQSSGIGFTASFSWLRSDTMTSRLTGVQLAAHELGHGFGLNHARSRGYGPPQIPLGAINAAGTLVEYGDNFSAMGNSNTGFYNAMHAVEILGWLTPANYSVVQTSGQYTVQAYETTNASGLVKALKVLRDPLSGSWVWLEYRTSTGIYDSQLGSQIFSGATIHYEDSLTGAGYTNLLDMTPATPSFLDPALAAGKTWSDPYSNLAITINSVTASAMTVTIGYGTAGCAPSAPTVTLSPLNPTVTAGGVTLLSVNVTSNKSPACPVSSYSLVSSQPAGFSGSFLPATLLLAGGATGVVALTETAGTATGTFPLSVTATDTAASGLSASGTANITVAAACSSSNPTVSLTPASVSLGAGGSTALTITVKNNNSAACAVSNYNLSAVQPAGFTGTLSKVLLSGIASGATGAVTLSETAGSTTGAFSLVVTATDSVKLTATSSASASITVTAACTAANPVVTLSPATVSLAASATTSFTITVANKNSSGCAASSYNLTAVQPAGFKGTLSPASLSGVAPGASGTVTLSETAGTTAGTFAVNITAMDAAKATYAGTASASITVAGACVPVAPVITATPTLASLKASSSTTFTISVQNVNPASCATTTYALTATQPTGLTGSLSVASLAVAPGATGTVTLKETSGATTGTFSVSVGATAGTFSKAVSLSVTVPGMAKTSARLAPAI